jgi:hypothetical protein
MSGLENILIVDDRLTPELKRVRSGKTMQFYDNDKRDRELLFAIEAPLPELFAELIDGIWHWVNQCDECNGKEAVWSYGKCDKHDVCITCSTPRKELKDTPWGTRGGFQCKPCADAIDIANKIEALTSVADKEFDSWDFISQDKPLCPHCESEIAYESSEISDGEDTCAVCNGTYKLTIEYDPQFTTEVVGDRVTLENYLAEQSDRVKMK